MNSRHRCRAAYFPEAALSESRFLRWPFRRTTAVVGVVLAIDCIFITSVPSKEGQLGQGAAQGGQQRRDSLVELGFGTHRRVEDDDVLYCEPRLGRSRRESARLLRRLAKSLQ